ncbi:anthrax toxin receptor-like [Otolemur garnettii]|uniref:anthrax toxin receptor-like n=1 Tax=Otolemur garnettii TaxID=30611 RepID=UPI000C7E8E3D|nr:anthrax toxin receptor-like [Otolemur garnettii]
MGRHGPWVPGFTLVLLLLPPPLLLSMRSFQHDNPRQRIIYHRPHSDSMSFQEQNVRHGKGRGKEKIPEFCNGAFDIYFIVDKKAMREQLTLMEDIEPGGDIALEEGVKKANEQIRQANSGDTKVSSMIMILLSGKLMPEHFKKTKEELNKARRMGANVYCVGVSKYNRQQVELIADSAEHMFAMDSGLAALYDLVDRIATKACLEIRSVDPSTVCVGEPKQIVVHGFGFNNAKEQDDVICRFKLSETKAVDAKPISVDETTITCPGPKMSISGQQIFVEVSLTGGRTFLSNDVSIKSTTCQPVNACPTVILSCCDRQGGGVCRMCRMNLLHDSMGPMYNFFQPSCNQLPFMWFPRRFQDRYLNLATVQPHCIPSSPKVCFRHSQECLPVAPAPLPIAQAPCAPCVPCVPKSCLRHSWHDLPQVQDPCGLKLCLPASQTCRPITRFSRCRRIAARCSRPPSRMLTLAPASTHSCP